MATPPDARSGEPAAEAAAQPPPIEVACGASTCPVVDGNFCCYVGERGTWSCPGPSDGCGVTATGVRTRLFCDGADDCAPGEGCCYQATIFQGAFIDSFASCLDARACPVRDDQKDHLTAGWSVCDPAHAASDCPGGTCTAARSLPKVPPQAPPNLHVCVR